MPKNALIVDNDFFFVAFLTEILEKAGYEVSKAYNGKECISILGKKPVDILFIDLIMPKIDGKEVVKFVRNKFGHEDISIIVVSGYIAEQADKIDEIDADYYIVKGPMENLKTSIKKAIDEIEKNNLSLTSPKDILGLGDISPKEVTMELIESINFQHAIIQSLQLGILIVDADARIIKANEYALELLNKKLEDILNSWVTVLFKGKEKNKLISALKKVVKSDNIKKSTLTIMMNSAKIRIAICLLKIEGKPHGWIITMEEVDQKY